MDTLCVINRYKVTCTDPDNRILDIDENNNKTGEMTSKCLLILNFDTTIGVTSIGVDETSLDSNAYAGVYKLQIFGWNDLSPDNKGELTIEFTIWADCSQEVIEDHVDGLLRRKDQDNNVIYEESYIEQFVHQEATTYEMSQFTI